MRRDLVELSRMCLQVLVLLDVSDLHAETMKLEIFAFQLGEVLRAGVERGVGVDVARLGDEVLFRLLRDSLSRVSAMIAG